MTNRDIFLLILLVAGTVLLFLIHQFSIENYVPPEKPQLPVKEISPQRYDAPDFTLRDLAGTKHRLSDFRGNVVALMFWTTW